MILSHVKYLQGIRFIIEGNFYISVLVFILGIGLSISPEYMIFEFNEELYGVLAQNLKMMLVFLAFSELLICSYCYLIRNRRMFMFVGLFFLLMIGSLPFYAEVNNIEIDPDLTWFFGYVGISHLLFGLYAYLEAKQSF